MLSLTSQPRPRTSSMRILLIEDEAELARWLARSLARHAGFVVEWADDGLVAERRLAMEEFDAVVLDLGLPGMDGHSLLARMRARDDRTPVLVLTARDSLAEKSARCMKAPMISCKTLCCGRVGSAFDRADPAQPRARTSAAHPGKPGFRYRDTEIHGPRTAPAVIPT